MARTITEASAQKLTVPEFEGWFEFANTLNGWELFGSLGRTDGDISALRSEHRERYRATGTWEGSLLELRVYLYFEAKAQHLYSFSGYKADEDPEFRALMTDLLDAIRARAKAAGKLAKG